MNDNLHLIVNGTPLTLTPLGEVVMAVRERCLLELFVATLKRGKMEFEDISTIIRTSHEDRESLAQEFKLKHFLEIVVLDRSKDISMATTSKAVVCIRFEYAQILYFCCVQFQLLLVEILFARLATSHAPKPPKSTPFTLYGSRHKWLDNVVPFGEEGVAESAGLEKWRTPGYLHDVMQLQVKWLVVWWMLSLWTLCLTSHVSVGSSVQ